MYNRIILIGNLTKDPELRYTPQGTPVASFRIAVNSKFKQSEGFREETLFIDVVTFGKQAETCSQYLNKGSSILVEGRLQERRWETEGQQKSKVEVVAQTVRFLPRRGESQGQRGEAETAPPEEMTDLEPF
ncbi:MAG TPA: single-stranded DNA-binding protein [Thermodesulfovibrionales bacterium]|jgi:single-strand DNA-binding protein|nr:single-stranded DNA-binding protein [Thermodesulfovibrionales bacterium]